MKKYCEQCKQTYTGISDSNECPECETPFIPESSKEKSGMGTMITPCSNCGLIYCENIVNGKCAIS